MAAATPQEKYVEATLYTDSTVKAFIADVSSSVDSPVGKARKLLGMCHRLEEFCRTLEHGCSVLMGDCDDDGASRLLQTMILAKRQQTELRAAARSAMRGRSPLGFNTQRPPRDYPQWATGQGVIAAP